MNQGREYSIEEIERMNSIATDAGIQGAYAEMAGAGFPDEALGLFREHIPGTRVLDAGCGWGRYVPRFRKLGFDYFGVDLSEQSIAYACEDYPDACFAVGSYRQLCLPDESIDGVWACCTLGYLPKQSVHAALLEFCRVLVPGGVIAIIEPYGIENGKEGPVRSRHSDHDLYLASWGVREFLTMLEHAPCAVEDSFVQPYDGAMVFIAKKKG